MLVDDPLPAGEARFYLVAGVADGQQGTLGRNGWAEPRPAGPGCP